MLDEPLTLADGDFTRYGVAESRRDMRFARDSVSKSVSDSSDTYRRNKNLFTSQFARSIHHSLTHSSPHFTSPSLIVVAAIVVVMVLKDTQARVARVVDNASSDVQRVVDRFKATTLSPRSTMHSDDDEATVNGRMCVQCTRDREATGLQHLWIKMTRPTVCPNCQTLKGRGDTDGQKDREWTWD